MATVKVIGQIKTTLAKSLAYIARPDATTHGLWVSTNAAVIDPSDFKAVARQMSDTVERVGVTKMRDGGVLAHHVVQSFDPKEAMSTEVAHRLGVQLAEQITGGKHEYMIATHQDKGHLHNHIIFNAVNLETGRKFRMLKDSQPTFRAMSDELCKVAGLTVLPPPERAAKHSTQRSLTETNLILKGESWKEKIRVEIDRAASKATSWEQFTQTLANAGVETNVRGGRNSTLTFRLAGVRDNDSRSQAMKRPIRDWRLGAAYTEESIMARMSKQVMNMVTVDASMIVRESMETLTITVPGTQRELQMTVAKSQIVRAERTLRVYVPAQTHHVLAKQDGTYAKTVTTAGLYDFFSQPDIEQLVKGNKDKALVGQFVGWNSELADLRELAEKVNAKARWMHATGDDATTALDNARERLAERHDRYQTTLVALAEVQASPTPDMQEVRVLTAELNNLERGLEDLKSDVRALTKLTQQEAKLDVSDRIASQVAAAKGRAATAQQQHTETTAQRARVEDHENDRETPAQQEQREEVQTGLDQQYEDQAHDRDAGQEPDNAPKTLAERLAERQAALRETKGRRDSGPTTGRNR